MELPNDSMENEDLVIIDIADLDFDDETRIKTVVEKLAHACETSGFFYLKIEEKFGRHCVDVLDAARQIFRLSPEDKTALINDDLSRMKVRGTPIPGTGAGLRPIGEDPNFAEDVREIYNVSVPIHQNEEIIDQFAKNYSGNGRNKWPKPESVKENWRSVVNEYSSKCLEACKVLARLFALALGLDKHFFEQPGYFDNPTCLLGMNYYHFREVTWTEGDPFGIKPHMDSGIFTLLLTDGSPGLERCVNRKLMSEATETSRLERIWVPVPCPIADNDSDGLLIVNMGKNMDYITGGRFRATLHRVVNKTGAARYSIPFFYEPNMEAVLEPLISDQDPRKHEMREYLQKTFGQDKITPADLFFERLQQRHNKAFDP